MEVPEVRYARSGDFHIAYQRFGAGPDVVSIPPLISNVEIMWEHEVFRRSLELRASRTRGAAPLPPRSRRCRALLTGRALAMNGTGSVAYTGLCQTPSVTPYAVFVDGDVVWDSEMPKVVGENDTICDASVRSSGSSATS